MRAKLLVITLLFFSFFFIPNSLAQINITNCTIIDTPGEYILVNDIEAISITCFDLKTASDVIFDCDWHTIMGVGATRAFHVWNRTNVTIRNCYIRNFSEPIHCQEYPSNILIENIDIGNSYTGVTLFTASNSELRNITVWNITGIGVQIYDSYNIYAKNIVAYNNSHGIIVSGGSNNTLEDIETYYTTPENPGIDIHSPNTTLRNIYNHDEYRSVIDEPNSVLEYSRCSNVIYGCWHIFANNTIVRHNNFPDAIGLFGTFYTEVYNNTFGPPTVKNGKKKPVSTLEIRDLWGVAPSFNKIYNNTFNNSVLWNRWSDYQPVSTEIYNNSFYIEECIVDEGFNTSIYDNTFIGCRVSIVFANGATSSNAFLNYINDGSSNGCENVTISNIFGNETMYLGELCSPYAFYFNGAKGITINNNTVEIDTLAYFESDPKLRYNGVISDVLSCNNTIVAFNKSWEIDKDYPPILLNVMRIESSQCTPFLDVTFYPSVDFGAVNPYSVVEVFPNLTVSSNMINLTYQIRGDTDWIGEIQNFSISTLMFGVDRYFPYPATESVTLELNVFKKIFHFLVNQFNNLLENVWRFEVPFVSAGTYHANVTMVVSNE
jgi:hypothetical protein